MSPETLTSVQSAPSPALAAYEPLAPFYDRLTADYAHATWLGELEAAARRHGLAGRRLLDVGCGTGKSFLPMLERGYEVVGCDISPAMVALAREKLASEDEESVFVADMRRLPEIGPFDLLTCLDDAVNYLLSPADLRRTMRSFARVLAPGGIAVFDVNTLSTYRTTFAEDFLIESGGTVFHWHGEAAADVEPGQVCTASIEVLSDPSGGGEAPVRSRHVQRHYPRPEVEAACRLAGLDVAAVHGHIEGGRLAPDADESLHPKLIYVARKGAAGQIRHRGEVPLP